jgi:nucleotide-binding universal stress UspA family protein
VETYKRILIPTDGSEYTKTAVAHGLMLAKTMGAEVTTLYVLDEASYVFLSDGLSIPNLYAQMEEEGKRAVQHVADEAESMGMKATPLIKRGHPAQTIAETSKDFDLVVMGTLGRTGMSHIMLGSVAERVVRYSACPVLLVRKASD